MKTYDERVPHAGEDLKRVDLARLNIDRIGLNDGHIVTVNAEGEVRIARDRNQTETVTLAGLDADNSEVGAGAIAVTTQTVDQSGIGSGESSAETSKGVVPVSKGNNRALCYTEIRTG